jgi:hypothetical protein
VQTCKQETEDKADENINKDNHKTDNKRNNKGVITQSLKALGRLGKIEKSYY